MPAPSCAMSSPSSAYVAKAPSPAGSPVMRRTRIPQPRQMINSTHSSGVGGHDRESILGHRFPLVSAVPPASPPPRGAGVSHLGTSETSGGVLTGNGHRGTGRAPRPPAVPPHHFHMTDVNFYTSEEWTTRSLRPVDRTAVPGTVRAAVSTRATRAPCPRTRLRVPQNEGPENSCGRQLGRSRRWELIPLTTSQTATGDAGLDGVNGAAVTAGKRERSGGVQSLDRAFTLLEIMAEAGGETSLSELAHSSGLPLPTIHRIVRSLVGNGYVRQLP